MSRMLNDEKPDLETLAHFGVLGMKWGKTRTKGDTGQIRSAQRNFANERNKLWDQQSAAKKFKKGTKERAAADVKTGKLKVALLKNPDRVLAARLTRGEKVALAIISIAVPPALPGALATVVGSSVASRRIEKKQDDGAFDKKK